MLSTPERLRTIRRLHRFRAEALSARDLAFAVYVVLFLIAVVGTPVVVLLVRAMGHPASLRVLESPGVGQTVGLLAGVGLAAMAALGAMRGPVILSPFLTHLVAASDMARRNTLLRPFLIASSALVVVVTGTAVILSGVLLHAGSASVSASAGFTLASTSYGVLLGVAWLCGQALGPTRAWRLTGLTLLAVAATWVVPALASVTPWGSLGLLWPTSPAGVWWPYASSGLSAVVSVGLTPRLLDSLRGPALQDQASRWQAAGVSVRTADFAGALERYRTSPRVGRSWRAVISAPPVVRFAIRDLIGAARTPSRLAVGSTGLALAGWLTHLSFALDENSWIPGVMGACLGYASAGVVTDGLRHAAEAAAAPPLYGCSNAALFWLHSIFPTLWTLTCMLLGVVFAWPPQPELGSLTSTAALGVLLVVMRAYDSAKGFIPPLLMDPAPSPAGDLSGLFVLTWQIDAPLLVTVTAAISLSTLEGSTGVIELVYLLVTTLVLTLTRRRIRVLEAGTLGVETVKDQQ